MIEFDTTIVEDPRPTGARTVPRLWLLIALLVLVAGALISRSFWLQVVSGASLRERAEHNRVYRIVTEAPRGIIYDRTNKPLVGNISATDLVCDPRTVPTREEETALIDTILQLLPDVQPDEVRSTLERCRLSGQIVPIARALNHETVLILENEQERLRGTTLVSSLVRDYKLGHMLAHILGYSSLVSGEDLEHDPSLALNDKIGKYGIEKVYDTELRGKAGITYQEVNASGQIQEQLGSAEPVAGQDLQITIDADFQEFIYGRFSEREEKLGKPVSGAAVVLDPRSGEVIAAVSYPSFDPNTFSQPGKQKDAARFITDPRQPLFDRVVSGNYASGSTVKPFLAAAALEEHIITPSTTINSSGGISVGPWRFPDWKAGGHGTTDVKKAIAESVNTFFYAISGGYENQPGLGVDRATHYLQAFGWGEPSGIDLPSEAAGFLPSPEWKEEAKGEPWYIGDTYHLGIGQGDLLVTPLQLAAATGAVADGKHLRQPHLVAQDTSVRTIPVSPANMQVVREGMRQTVTEGSARSLAPLPIALAGKTGTAQVGGTEETHAWFTSFAPYDDPQLVVTVLLERGGEGDKDAVPFANEVWHWWIENRLKTGN